METVRYKWKHVRPDRSAYIWLSSNEIQMQAWYIRFYDYAIIKAFSSFKQIMCL